MAQSANHSQETTHETRSTYALPREIWWHRLGMWLLERVWYVHPRTYLWVNLPPVVCMQVLVTLAKPSMQHLEYRNLFANGRRYFFNMRQGNTDRFYMSSTHKLLWSRRRRTQTATIIMGDLQHLDTHLTRIALQGRMRLMYMLDIVPLPLFTTSLIIFMPWHPVVIGSLIVILFGLSWIAHRYNAALEAHTMLFFLERALENHMAQPILLDQDGAHIVYENIPDFGQAWERFMQDQSKI